MTKFDNCWCGVTYTYTVGTHIWQIKLVSDSSDTFIQCCGLENVVRTRSLRTCFCFWVCPFFWGDTRPIILCGYISFKQSAIDLLPYPPTSDALRIIPEKHVDICRKQLTYCLISESGFLVQRNSICSSLFPSFAGSKLIWNPQDEAYTFKILSPLDVVPDGHLCLTLSRQWLLWLQNAFRLTLVLISANQWIGWLVSVFIVLINFNWWTMLSFLEAWESGQNNYRYKL